MCIQIRAYALAAVLRKLAPFVGTKKACKRRPILGFVRVGMNCDITATDGGDCYARLDGDYIPWDAEDWGGRTPFINAFLIPLREMVAWLTNVNKGALVTLWVENGDVLHVRADQSWVQFPILSADDFPAYPRLQWQNVADFYAGCLPAAIKATSHAVDPESTRFALTAVALDITRADRHAVASDGKRMITVDLSPRTMVAYTPDNEPSVEGVYLIDAKYASGLCDILGDLDVLMSRNIGDADASLVNFFCAEGVDVIIRLTAGRYPQWREVMRMAPAVSYRATVDA